MSVRWIDPTLDDQPALIHKDRPRGARGVYRIVREGVVIACQTCGGEAFENRNGHDVCVSQSCGTRQR